MPVCNNCHQSFEGKYCSHCGQKASVGRLTIQEVFHEVVHSLLHAEKGIIKLTKGLLFSPAKVYTGYFSGKRKTYFSPVTFFLLSMGLLVFLGTKMINWDTSVTGRANHVEKILFGFQKIRYIIFIPVISLITWLFFYKRYNLAECLCFWLFCIGTVVVLELVSYLPQFIWVKERHVIRYYTDWLVWLAIVFHIVIVFGDRSLLSYIKCIVLGIGTYFILVYIYKFLGYLQGYNADFNFSHILKDIFG